MDKQQAALDWVWKYKPPPFAVSITDKEIAAFEAGWEAQEVQQSPTGAVATLKYIADTVRNMAIPYYAYGGNEAACAMAVQLNLIRENCEQALTNINPSGAAPQVELTHIEALKHVKETLQWMFDNMTADDKRDVQDSHDRPLNAIHAIELALQSASAPPAAGTVWVKGEYERLYAQVKGGKRSVCFVDYSLPKHDKTFRDVAAIEPKTLEIGVRGQGYSDMSYDEGAPEIKRFVNMCLCLNVEWLDESAPAQQLFTREQVSDAFHAGIISGLDSAADRPFISQDEYMNTTYSPSNLVL